MAAVERRRAHRTRCGSLAALITHGRHVSHTLIEDVSPRGMLLAGDDLSRPETWLQITIATPHHALQVAARVAWRDPAGSRIGVELAPVGPDLRRVIDGLAFEHEHTHHGALVIVDAPSAAAWLCDPLRERGYVPVSADSTWDVLNRLADRHPPIEVAIVAPEAFGMSATYFVDLIATRHPHVEPIVLGTEEEDLAAAFIDSFG